MKPFRVYTYDGSGSLRNLALNFDTLDEAKQSLFKYKFTVNQFVIIEYTDKYKSKIVHIQ